MRRERHGFGQWMNSSVIQDNIFFSIHKKCHMKSYRSDINIMPSVVTYKLVDYKK